MCISEVKTRETKKSVGQISLSRIYGLLDDLKHGASSGRKSVKGEADIGVTYACYRCNHADSPVYQPVSSSCTDNGAPASVDVAETVA